MESLTRMGLHTHKHDYEIRDFDKNINSSANIIKKSIDIIWIYDKSATTFLVSQFTQIFCSINENNQEIHIIQWIRIYHRYGVKEASGTFQLKYLLRGKKENILFVGQDPPPELEVSSQISFYSSNPQSLVPLLMACCKNKFTSRHVNGGRIMEKSFS